MRTNICLAFMALFALVPFTGINAQYSLTVEASAPAAATTPGMVYRFYVNANDATDKLSAVFGNDQAHLVISTPDGIFNSAFNSSWSASGISVLHFLVCSRTWLMTAMPRSTSPGQLLNQEQVQRIHRLLKMQTLSPSVSGYFIGGGTELNVNTLTGASWYVLNTAANALPTSDRWLIAQVTTAGSISGQINYQIFPLGVGADQVQMSVTFDGAGEFGGTNNMVNGCTDASACNYDADADTDDGSCTYPADATLDCAGNCVNDADGDGICDENEILGCTLEAACNYNPAATDNDGTCAQEDAVGVCGGSCQVDADMDGICDDIDDCIGSLDSCGVCNGDNSTCTDCAGVVNGTSVLDDCGVCGGDNSTCTDCAGVVNGTSVLDDCGVCGGDNSTCTDCAGVVNGTSVLDDCGVCGGDNSTCTDCAGVVNGNFCSRRLWRLWR